MLTSWSEVSTPAELSMKSVFDQAAGERVLDPRRLGEAQVAALGHDPARSRVASIRTGVVGPVAHVGVGLWCEAFT